MRPELEVYRPNIESAMRAVREERGMGIIGQVLVEGLKTTAKVIATVAVAFLPFLKGPVEGPALRAHDNLSPNTLIQKPPSET